MWSYFPLFLRGSICESYKLFGRFVNVWRNWLRHFFFQWQGNQMAMVDKFVIDIMNYTASVSGCTSPTGIIMIGVSMSVCEF